ncbi:TlpA disulfide reductase family protein [Phenylobacterium sp.]|uniref:TlpA family protein disulfide reductase n=1 Tax=Phenylobacterium sp. TaxID=1871053 RepID=UPI002735AF08|nr:TlpA disulfide reductase family protein [Phenylobacterium sp.]MDP3658798.1 TlpA disulfide reductase family protein [Phenylobacterium sp.]
MSDHSTAKPRAGLLKWALWGAAGLGVAAVVYIMVQASTNPTRDAGLKPLARGEMAKLTTPAEATAAPANSFYDAAGKPVRLADFKGKVVVLNMWATWCGPCIIEMPTLAKLQTSYAGKPVEVVAVSIDGEKDQDKARQFIGQHAPLKFYADPKFKLPFAFTPPATGMPTTVIFGPEGVERGRLAGGADWSTPEARAVIDHVLAEG